MFSERMKAGRAAWDARFLGRIYTMWDVSQKRSFNELASVSMQAPKNLEPATRAGLSRCWGEHSDPPLTSRAALVLNLPMSVSALV